MAWKPGGGCLFFFDCSRMIEPTADHNIISSGGGGA